MFFGRLRVVDLNVIAKLHCAVLRNPPQTQTFKHASWLEFRGICEARRLSFLVTSAFRRAVCLLNGKCIHFKRQRGTVLKLRTPPEFRTFDVAQRVSPLPITFHCVVRLFVLISAPPSPPPSLCARYSLTLLQTVECLLNEIDESYGYAYLTAATDPAGNSPITSFLARLLAEIEVSCSTAVPRFRLTHQKKKGGETSAVMAADDRTGSRPNIQPEGHEGQLFFFRSGSSGARRVGRQLMQSKNTKPSRFPTWDAGLTRSWFVSRGAIIPRWALRRNLRAPGLEGLNVELPLKFSCEANI